MTIGITGASGQLGLLVVKKLIAKVPSADIVALVCTPARAANLGVSVRDAAYSKPETLDRALAGIDTLLLISFSEVSQRRAAQHHNVIEAAKRTGVKRIVYTSLLHADTSPLNLSDEHRATEAELRVAGIPFTILRNGWYTENYTASAPVSWQVVLFLVAPATARYRPPFVPTMPRRPSPY
jgi:NAD(P)H dehydrogenase (quinone)